MQAIDISGVRFGRLTAMWPVSRRPQSRWSCACDCGTTAVVLLSQLRRGKTTSCGCYRKEAAGKRTNHHARFWERVEKTDSCWNWTGYTQKTHHRKEPSYGRVYYKNSMILAHRFSWLLHNGEIPAGMKVCHTCDNPKCVNPAHLFLGTQRDNVLDMIHKGRRRRHQ